MQKHFKCCHIINIKVQQKYRVISQKKKNRFIKISPI
nr:MAG TPA: hypothetical protein [Caudoviricetes sp.]